MSEVLCIQTGLPCGVPCYHNCKDKCNVKTSVTSGEDGLVNLQPPLASKLRHKTSKSAENWKRINVPFGTARITKDCPNETIKAIIKMCIRAVGKV